MDLTMFQSDKGDCLMLESGGSKPVRMLIDGGMEVSYKKHVAPALSKLPQLDLVYVSHIDDDHIAGVLKLFDDMVDWRVYTYQRSQGNTSHAKPRVPRPPPVRELWHNPFSEQVGDNTEQIEKLLATAASLQAAAGLGELSAHGDDSPAGIITGVNQAVRLRRRASAQQLNIPVNTPAKGRLMLADNSDKPITLGPLKIHVIGPFKSQMLKLRKEWNTWLAKSKAALQKIREDADRVRRGMGLSELDQLIQPLLFEAKAFANVDVSEANITSLMLLVESAGKRLLLTGDGIAEDILKGLKLRGLLRADGTMHVDVLKVQHHGSDRNIDPDFCRRITADHYVICGNGFQDNPELAVIDAIIDSRRGSGSKRSPNAEAGQPFEFWFNFASTNPDQKKFAAHLRKVEKLVNDGAKQPGAKFKAHWLTNASSLTLSL